MATFGSLWLSGRSVRDRRALVRVHTNPSPIQTHAERNAIDFCNGPNLGRKECHPTGARRVARDEDHCLDVQSGHDRCTRVVIARRLAGWLRAHIGPTDQP